MLMSVKTGQGHLGSIRAELAMLDEKNEGWVRRLRQHIHYPRHIDGQGIENGAASSAAPTLVLFIKHRQARPDRTKCPCTRFTDINH